MGQCHGATWNSESGSKKIHEGNGGKPVGAARASSIENLSRELSWTNFLSLLFLFSKNADTARLLPVMGIYTEELESLFSFTDLNKLK